MMKMKDPEYREKSLSPYRDLDRPVGPSSLVVSRTNAQSQLSLHQSNKNSVRSMLLKGGVNQSSHKSLLEKKSQSRKMEAGRYSESVLPYTNSNTDSVYCQFKNQSEITDPVRFSIMS